MSTMSSLFFFLNDTATTEIYPLPLHAALPILHKAPANEILRGVVGLETQVTKGEQDILNPNGINCIRTFPGRGIRIWGARTLSSDPSWRYINVRRLFNMIEESIDRGTQWAVFEPNEIGRAHV